MISIDDFIEQSIEENKKHGLKGDKTLECVAAGIKDDVFIKSKVYYENKNKSEIELMNTEPCKSICEDFSQRITAIENLRFCDIGRFVTDNDTIYALNFNASKVKHEQTSDVAKVFAEAMHLDAARYEKLLKDIDAAKHMIDEGMAVLTDIGIKFDAKGRCLALKYYLPLRRSTTADTGFDEICRSFILATGSNVQLEKVAALAEILQNNHYMPILSAITLGPEGETEQKMYFDIGSCKRRDIDIFESAKNLIEEMQLDGIFNEDRMARMQQNGLYLRGFGLKTQNPSEIKLYFDKIK